MSPAEEERRWGLAAEQITQTRAVDAGPSKGGNLSIFVKGGSRRAAAPRPRRIWTGWLAFLIFIPLAITSNDRSQRWLKSTWKKLQRWVYPAAVLTLLHWIFVHNDIGPALVHFVPLAALELFRVYCTYSPATKEVKS